MVAVPSGLEATAPEAFWHTWCPHPAEAQIPMISEPRKDEGFLQTVKVHAKPKQGSKEEPRAVDLCRAGANTSSSVSAVV